MSTAESTVNAQVPQVSIGWKAVAVRAGERAGGQWMNWKFISFSVEMGEQEDIQELRGCKFMFPVWISSCMCSLHCAGVGLWLLQGLHWLINYKKKKPNPHFLHSRSVSS